MPVRCYPKQPLEIREYLDLPRFSPSIAQPQQPNLAGVLEGHEISYLALDISPSGLDHRVSQAMTHAISLQIRPTGLPTGRPKLTGLGVAQIQVFTPRISNQILFPAGDPIQAGVCAPGIPTARLGKDHPVISVGDDVNPWLRGVGVCDYVFTIIFVEIAITGLKHRHASIFSYGFVSLFKWAWA